MSAVTQQDALFRSRRREALRKHASLLGIDAVTVGRDPLRLLVAFVPPEAPATAAKFDALDAIATQQVGIWSEAGAPQTRLRATAVRAQHEQGQIEIALAYDGDGADDGAAPVYTLELRDVPQLDPFFSQIRFSLEADVRSALDPRRVQHSAPRYDDALPPAPPIDYLARDYDSFRQLMLNRLALLLPRAQTPHAAGVEQVLVEIMAYTADRLSYYQDAVATEAYLGTARRRISLRRHARLIDYRMHEGCNARVWVQVQVTGAGAVLLPDHTPLLTGRHGATPALDTDALRQALNDGATVFETQHAATLRAEHNEIALYGWSMSDYTLPVGATSAALAGDYPNLEAGQVLIFQELVGPTTGDPRDANPAHRVAVRLDANARRDYDALGGPDKGAPITWIRWHGSDALRAPVVAVAAGRQVSVVRGNIVLADHGVTIRNEPLDPPKAEGPRYLPRLQRAGLTYAEPYDHRQAVALPAFATLEQNPRRALAAVSQITSKASGGAEREWHVLHDLLGSDRFASAFVVEMEEGARAQIRFGDGTHGRVPAVGDTFEATYRVGNGHAGNVGRETIAHLVSDDVQLRARIAAVSNPLAAQGGSEPEPIEQVRLYAPRAARAQQRCVVEEDYAAVAERHPDVQKAAAIMRWTGSWYTAVVIVDRRGGRPVDAAFRAALLAEFERHRLAGYDIAVRAPFFVSLNIALTAYVAQSRSAAVVRQDLLEVFSAIELPDGRRGFFHPDNFTIAQPVYLSPIIAQAMRVAGVDRVEVARFGRWGRAPQGELEAGVIRLGPLEVARVQNDPLAPQKGLIELTLVGGR